MSMTTVTKVTGIKRSKGVMRDTGKEYDSTRIYVDVPFSDMTGNMKGSATQEFLYGKSENFEKFANLPFPFEAEVTFEMVTDGKSVKQEVVNVVPVGGRKVLNEVK